MKKILIIILVSLASISIKVFSQENNRLFCVIIDSVKVDGDKIMDKCLKFYITIKNHSSKNLEFYFPAPFLGGEKEYSYWYMILKKNGKIPIEWDDSRYQVYYEPDSKFMVKKSKEAQVKFLVPVSSMLLLGLRDNLSGNYTVQIEVSNIESKKIRKQTVLSNIVNFQIENPIVDYF